MPTITIRQAVTDQEKSEVYRFRYAIYVEAMGRKPANVDHYSKMLCDPLDATALNLIATEEDRAVGVIRNNFPRDGDIGQFEEFYGLKYAGADHPLHTSITTGLMVAPERRGTTVAVRLAMASYEIGLQRNTRKNFIDCIPELEPFFRRLGWRSHLPTADHPEYPLKVKRMQLDLFDESHLLSMRSPFARLLQTHKAAAARRSYGDLRLAPC